MVPPLPPFFSLALRECQGPWALVAGRPTLEGAPFGEARQGKDTYAYTTQSASDPKFLDSYGGKTPSRNVISVVRGKGRGGKGGKRKKKTSATHATGCCVALDEVGGLTADKFRERRGVNRRELQERGRQNGGETVLPVRPSEPPLAQAIYIAQALTLGRPG